MSFTTSLTNLVIPKFVAQSLAFLRILNGSRHLE